MVISKSKKYLFICRVIDYCTQNDFKKIVVFATAWTLKSGLYATALQNAGITPIVPKAEDLELLGNLIYPNLENGIVIPEDKEKTIALAEKYIKENSVDSLLLGCTEIPLMIKENEVSVPVINTTKIHIKAIFNEADS